MSCPIQLVRFRSLDGMGSQLAVPEPRPTRGANHFLATLTLLLQEDGGSNGVLVSFQETILEWAPPQSITLEQ